MCGRFVRGGDATDYAEAVGGDVVSPAPRSYNVAPTQPVLAACVLNGRREATFFRWGRSYPCYTGRACRSQRGPRGRGPMPSAAIAHLDADCSYVSAERVRDPFLLKPKRTATRATSPSVS